MSYKDFKDINMNWDDGVCRYYPVYGDDLMRRNFEIAREVKRGFYRMYDRTSMQPQKGDVIEFVYCNHLNKHAIVEDVDRFGVMYVCENGSTFTDAGMRFSTSGGAFTHIHKSHFEFVGYATRRFWTWGANGAGRNQGIYFDVTVKKFRQTDAPKLMPKNKIYFCNPYYKKRGSAVVIASDYCGGIFWEFEKISEFRKWSEHVGLTYHKRSDGAYFTDQFLKDRFFWRLDDIPSEARPVEGYSNGRKVRCFAHKDGDTITFYRPNPNAREVYVPFDANECMIKNK